MNAPTKAALQRAVEAELARAEYHPPQPAQASPPAPPRLVRPPQPAPIVPTSHKPQPGGFSRFNMTGKTDEMREKMLDQVEVLPRLALLGQWTAFYAAPNTGKTMLTLWMLREAIRAKSVDGSRVLYINCDDTWRGLVEKAEFAKEAGFGMASDGLEGFKASMLLPEMERAINEGDAEGTVLVLDTLKKFIGLMDKTKQTEANKTLRKFIMAGEL